ncbi:hypothetical protein NL676_000445 [Syzygium grande]|nr:hypothetical protein NL676_000445 [Syzygium grande]
MSRAYAVDLLVATIQPINGANSASSWSSDARRSSSPLTAAAPARPSRAAPSPTAILVVTAVHRGHARRTELTPPSSNRCRDRLRRPLPTVAAAVLAAGAAPDQPTQQLSLAVRRRLPVVEFEPEPPRTAVAVVLARSPALNRPLACWRTQFGSRCLEAGFLEFDLLMK